MRFHAINMIFINKIPKINYLKIPIYLSISKLGKWVPMYFHPFM